MLILPHKQIPDSASLGSSAPVLAQAVSTLGPCHLLSGQVPSCQAMSCTRLSTDGDITVRRRFSMRLWMYQFQNLQPTYPRSLSCHTYIYFLDYIYISQIYCNIVNLSYIQRAKAFEKRYTSLSLSLSHTHTQTYTPIHMYNIQINCGQAISMCDYGCEAIFTVQLAIPQLVTHLQIKRAPTRMVCIVHLHHSIPFSCWMKN